MSSTTGMEQTLHRREWYKRQFTIIGDPNAPEHQNVDVTKSAKTDITKLAQQWDTLYKLIHSSPNRCGRYGQGRTVRAFDGDDHDSECEDGGLCSKVPDVEDALNDFLEELLKPFVKSELHIHRYISPFDIDDDTETMCTDWTYIVNVHTDNAHYFGTMHLKCYEDQQDRAPQPKTSSASDPLCSYTSKLSDYIRDSFFWAGENKAGQKCDVLEVFYGMPKCISLESMCDLIGLQRTYKSDDASM